MPYLTTVQVQSESKIKILGQNPVYGKDLKQRFGTREGLENSQNTLNHNSKIHQFKHSKI